MPTKSKSKSKSAPKAKPVASPKSEKILKLFDNTLRIVEEQVLDLKHGGIPVANVEAALVALRPKRVILGQALDAGDSETINLIITVLKKLALTAREKQLDAKKSAAKEAEAKELAKEVAVVKKAAAKERVTTGNLESSVKTLMEKVTHLESELSDARKERDDLRTRVERQAGVDLTPVFQKIEALSSEVKRVETSELPNMKGELDAALGELRHSLNRIEAANGPNVGSERLKELEASFNSKLNVVAKEVQLGFGGFEETKALVNNMQDELSNIETQMAASSKIHNKFGSQLMLLAELAKKLDQKIVEGDTVDQADIQKIKNELSSLAAKLASEEEKKRKVASKSLKGMQDKMVKLESSEAKSSDELASDLEASMKELAKLRKTLGEAHA